MRIDNFYTKFDGTTAYYNYLRLYIRRLIVLI